MSRKRPSRKSAAAKVWALPVMWFWRREPDPPQVVVIYVDAAAGTVMGAAPRAAVAGKAAPGTARRGRRDQLEQLAEMIRRGQRTE